MTLNTRNLSLFKGTLIEGMPPTSPAPSPTLLITLFLLPELVEWDAASGLPGPLRAVGSLWSRAPLKTKRLSPF